jgi:hypothetical protein
MSSSSNPILRTAPHALLVATAAARPPIVQLLTAMGFECGGAEDPYSAMAELCRRPLVYRTLVIGLGGVYREELAMIAAIKRRLPHLDVLLAQTDGRQAALADALRLGADGLVDDDGIHRLAEIAESRTTPPTSRPIERPPVREPLPAAAPESESTFADPVDEPHPHEPVLTAEELRALLQDPSPMPPSGEVEP